MTALSRSAPVRSSVYSAYGLYIESTLPLPELEEAAPATADVFVRQGTVRRPPLSGDPEVDWLQVTDTEVYLFWKHVGSFVIRDGREITVDPAPYADDRMVRAFLLGAVLAILLIQRGHLVLHASAAVIDGNAVAFVGDRGWGKSTMAAALYTQGHHHLADDLVALVTQTTGLITVLPGFPQFKLWPDAAASLGDDPAALPQLYVDYDKRARRITDRFAVRASPLRCLYVLDKADEPMISPMPPHEALITVIRHSYTARFGKELLTGSLAAAHFRQCAQLVHRVPVRRLGRPAELDLLPDVARMVAADIAEITGAVPELTTA